LDTIVALVTIVGCYALGYIVAFVTIVAFAISLNAVMLVHMQYLENDWTDFHEIWFGRYPIGA
jgi:hypothetical protein